MTGERRDRNFTRRNTLPGTAIVTEGLAAAATRQRSALGRAATPCFVVGCAVCRYRSASTLARTHRNGDDAHARCLASAAARRRRTRGDSCRRLRLWRELVAAGFFALRGRA